MALILGDTVLLASIFSLVIWCLQRKSKSSLPLPPGPKPLPLFGNLFSIPRHNAHLVYREWSKLYGSDIIHASAPGMEIVVLNSARAVDAIMNKRSATCSDRPPMTGTHYLGLSNTLGTLPYGHELRAQRKVYHVHLSPNTVQTYEPVQARAVHNLLCALLDTPTQFREHSRQMVGEILIAIAYGIQVRKDSDPYIALAEDAMKWLSRSLQFEGLVLDMFPLLQKMPSWVPGAGFKRASAEGRRVIDDVMNKPFQATKDAMAAGTTPPSVLSKMLEESTTDEFAKLLIPSIYMIGSDTTLSTLLSFFLAMLISPDAQTKAQAELDGVLGSPGSRLPTLADAPHLPYIDALVDELLRWHPAVPLDVPHACKADEVVDGYLIPAGTTIFANLYALLHDPALFPNPDAFKPEHYLSPDQGGTFPEDADVPGSLREIPFSIGRRICPGRHLARPMIWLAVASVLTVYEILPAKDAGGRDIKVEEKYEDGLVSFPAPFPCEIRLRSEAAGAFLRAMGV